MKCDPQTTPAFSDEYSSEEENLSQEGLYPHIAHITQTVSRVQTAILVRLGLNHSRWAILKFLDETGRSLRCSDLADLVNVSRATITGVLDTLEKATLIVRVPDPHDRRAFSVKITPRGEELLRQIRSELDEWSARVLGDFSLEETPELLGILSRLQGVLDEQASDFLETHRSPAAV